MSNSRISLTTILREPGFWILFAVTITFFYRPLFNDETFFYRDLYNHFYPQKKLFAELVLSGQLPLWDPYRHGGQPFLASMNNSVLYPTNVLYLILPPISAFNIDIVLHVLFAGWFSYLLARVLDLNQIGSLSCGFIYAFSGPTLSAPNVWLYVPSHVPLILMLWHLYCLEGKNRWFILTALVGTIQVFAGRPEISIFTAITLLGWTLVYPYGKKLQRLFRFCVLELTILGLSAIQMIPMLDLVQHSSRGQVVNLHTFFAWSVDLRRYPELILPNFLGSVYSLLGSDYWGGAFEDLGVPYIISLYFGVPVLLLAIIGGVNKSVDHQLPWRLRIFLLVLVVFSFVAIAGRHLPGFRAIFNAWPALAVFRYPVKFIFLAILPLALLAGYQLHHILQNAEQRFSRVALGVFWIVAASAVIVAAYCFMFPTSTENFFKYYFGTTALKGLRNSILQVAASSLVLALLMTFRNIRKKPGISAGVAILISLDLLLAGSAVNHFAPREFLTEIPDLASYIKKEIGDGRLYRSRDYNSLSYKVPSKDIVYADRWRLELLSNYTATIYNIPVVFHEDYDWLELKPMEDLTRVLTKLRWNQQLSILSSTAVRFVLTSDRLWLPDLRLVRVVNNASNTTYFLYKNERCAPRVGFVANSKITSTPSELVKQLTQPTFDPCATVLLEEATTGTGVNLANATVKTINWRSNSSIHFVNTDKPGFVVFSEPFTDGWKWKVDDYNVEPVRANYAFSAVAVPAGKHHVYRIYRPVSVILGCAVSLIFLVAIVIFSFLSKPEASPVLAPDSNVL